MVSRKHEVSQRESDLIGLLRQYHNPSKAQAVAKAIIFQLKEPPQSCEGPVSASPEGDPETT